MTKTETVTIPAAEVRVGDRPVNISSPIVSIAHVPGGFVFHTAFSGSFTRCHDESVTVKR